jgi:hypothetical protein
MEKTSEETFIHGEIEVRKTGRTAVRPVGPVGPKGPRRVQTIVEITPVSHYDGTWKKWVSPSSLFVIEPSPAKTTEDK